MLEVPWNWALRVPWLRLHGELQDSVCALPVDRRMPDVPRHWEAVVPRSASAALGRLPMLLQNAHGPQSMPRGVRENRMPREEPLSVE